MASTPRRPSPKSATRTNDTAARANPGVGQGRRWSHPRASRVELNELRPGCCPSIALVCLLGATGTRPGAFWCDCTRAGAVLPAGCCGLVAPICMEEIAASFSYGPCVLGSQSPLRAAGQSRVFGFLGCLYIDLPWGAVPFPRWTSRLSQPQEAETVKPTLIRGPTINHGHQAFVMCGDVGC